MERVENVVIYLTSWQKRMVAEYLPNIKSPKKVIIPGKIDPGSLVKYKPIDQDLLVRYRPIDPGLLVKYKPADHIPSDMSWRLYLTDTQIAALAEEGGYGPGISAVLINCDLLESGMVKFE
jgi:hypothetical protein